jgi:hypothetical protein
MVPDGPEEDPVAADPLPVLPETSPEADGVPEVDAEPSPAPVEEWVDDEHAAKATTAALRKGCDRSLMAGVLPGSGGSADEAAAVDADRPDCDEASMERSPWNLRPPA